MDSHADHDPGEIVVSVNDSGEIVVSGIDFREGERPGRSVKTFHKYVKAEGILEKTEATTGGSSERVTKGTVRKRTENPYRGISTVTFAVFPTTAVKALSTGAPGSSPSPLGTMTLSVCSPGRNMANR